MCRGRCSGKAVPVHAVENSPPGQGLRESTGLELMKEIEKQGGFKRGITVPG